MKAQADKTVAKLSKAAAGASPARQFKPESEVQFEDRRPAAVGQRALAGKVDSSPQAGRIAQLQAMADGSAAGTIQRRGMDEEEPMQGKLETIQRQGAEEEEELLQGKFATVQKRGLDEEEIQAKSAAVQKKDEQPANNTGLPDNLKSGIENLSGLSLDDVKVHYNSPKPAQLQAHAFAQGTDIHMAPGQEKHLPHEAWHVVQQKRGRVKPTKQLQGKIHLNDDARLEKEADVMGTQASATAVRLAALPSERPREPRKFSETVQGKFATVQRTGHEEEEEHEEPAPVQVSKKGWIRLAIEAAGHFALATIKTVGGMIAAIGTGGAALVPGIISAVGGVGQAIIGVCKSIRSHFLRTRQALAKKAAMNKIIAFEGAVAVATAIAGLVSGALSPEFWKGLVTVIFKSVDVVGGIIKTLRGAFADQLSESQKGILIMVESGLGFLSGLGSSIGAGIAKGASWIFKVVADVLKQIISLFKGARGHAKKSEA